MALIIDGSAGITFPAGGNGNPSGTVVGTTDSQTLTNKTVTAVSPLALTSASLGTAAAGNIEYDGKVLYNTPQSTQRGVMPGMQYYRLDSAFVGANVNTAQNILGVGVTLSSSTVYAFEIDAVCVKTAGTTAHTISFGYGGTATINNIYSDAKVIFFGGSLNTYMASGNYQATISNAATAVTTTGSSVTNQNLVYSPSVKGTVSVNAGGTFIPQYTTSAAPGGAYSTQAGSYMLIYPIGTANANVSVGTWA